MFRKLFLKEKLLPYEVMWKWKPPGRSVPPNFIMPCYYNWSKEEMNRLVNRTTSSGYPIIPIHDSFGPPLPPHKLERCNWKKGY